MLKFFKIVRQNLLSESKTGKYVKYAFGEIILVVIGILIALSINNWNTYRLDRMVETDYLQRISNDLTIDTLNFSWTIESLKDKGEALETLLNLLKNQQIARIDSTMLLSHIGIGRHLSIAHPGVANGTFQELVNTGSMRHVTNTLLRSAINNYYLNAEHQNDRIVKKRTQSNYSTIVNSRIPGIRRIGDETDYQDDLISYRYILDMTKEAEFKTAVIAEYNSALFMLRIQEAGLIASKELLDLIMEELNDPN